MKPVNVNKARDLAYETLGRDVNKGWWKVNNMVRGPILALTFSMPSQLIEPNGIEL